MGGKCNAAALMKFEDFDTFVLRLFKTKLVVKCKMAMAFFFFVKTGIYAVCVRVCARMRVCMFISYVIFVS